MAAFAFWACAALLVYVVAGYPLMLALLARLRPWSHRLDPDHEPTVTVTMAAHNQAITIAGKIDSILAQDYPADKLEVIVGSDGSTDATAEIVRGFGSPNVRVMELPRSGKATVNNRMTEAARGEIVIDTTSSGYFAPGFLRTVLPHFADHQVGCVTGEVGMASPDSTGVSQFEGAYFRYEWWLRHLESRVGLLCVSNGGVLAFRRELYDPIGPSSDVDNMVPLIVVAKGRKVVHEPKASTQGEPWVESHAAQRKGRIRQVTRSQQDIYRAGRLLNPLRHPAQAWVLWSHRLLRWWSPFFALAMLAANLFLLDEPFYLVTFLLQAAVYIMALAGRLLPELSARHRIISVASTVLNVATCFLVGTYHAIRRKQIVTW